MAYAPSSRSPVTVSVENAQALSEPGRADRIVIIAPGTVGTLTLWDGVETIKQVETATVLGLIEAAGAGNVDVIVTAVGMTDTGDTRLVAVANDDTAIIVAGKIRVALAADSDVNTFFAVSGTGAEVILTALTAADNDATMNLDIDDGTSAGLTNTPTSANTEAGFGESPARQLFARAFGDLTAGDVYELGCPVESGIRYLNTTGGHFYVVHSEY